MVAGVSWLVVEGMSSVIELSIVDSTDELLVGMCWISVEVVKSTEDVATVSTVDAIVLSELTTLSEDDDVCTGCEAPVNSDELSAVEVTESGEGLPVKELWEVISPVSDVNMGIEGDELSLPVIVGTDAVSSVFLAVIDPP